MASDQKGENDYDHRSSRNLVVDGRRGLSELEPQPQLGIFPKWRFGPGGPGSPNLVAARQGVAWQDVAIRRSGVV